MTQMSCFCLQKCDLENTNILKIKKKSKKCIFTVNDMLKTEKKKSITFCLDGYNWCIKKNHFLQLGGHRRGHNVATLALSHYFFFTSGGI